MRIVVSYRGIPRSPTWATGAFLADAFQKLGHDVFHYGKFFGTDRPVGSGEVPSDIDLWVYTELGDTDAQYEEIRTVRARRKVFWDFDTAIHLGFTLDFIDRVGFDHVFFGNKDFLELGRTVCPRVSFLPYAIADDRLYRDPNIPKTIDVGLVGFPFPRRVRFIERLQKSGLSAKLISSTYAEDMVRAVNSFRICLNYMVTGGRGLLNGRVWEAIGCGVLLLNEREDYIDEFFKDGEHLLLYGSFDECAEKARYALAHPEESERIARAGYEFGRAHHTYRHRAAEMLRAIDATGVTVAVSGASRRRSRRARARFALREKIRKVVGR